MGRHYSCCAEWCKNLPAKESSLSFFRFPKDKSRLVQVKFNIPRPYARCSVLQ